MIAPLRRLVAALLVISIGSLGLPLPANAAMLPTESALAAGDRARIAGLLDRAEVRAQLQARGVSADEVKARVAALTDEEAARLAARMDGFPAAGDGIIGALVLVFLVLLITDILGYTRVFTFTRPAR